MDTTKYFIKHTIPTHNDPRGDLTVFDKLDEIVDWQIKRSYWVTNTKLPRGGHCVKGERKFYVMAQGTCKAKVYDGKEWFEVELKGPGEALEFKADLWREFVDFSEGSVMFTLCNMHYDKSKYILDLKEYEEYSKTLNF
ncbi:FdtA/QdtA family cupin domain-containing protein [Candidatus Peregrinibacteria bacterium]|nr:FdtA/QdtA family cupin domain-containing protein [Candidatus Peregrinibacteria bacterium]